MLTIHQMSHQMNRCNPTCGSNNMLKPERWATKGRTVGGFVPVSHANVWSSTQHSHSGTMVQLAYHRLYNRPASPLSCLCSSSCSSPLLNKTQVWRWCTSTGHKIPLTEGKSEFYSSQAAIQAWAAATTSLRGWTNSWSQHWWVLLAWLASKLYSVLPSSSSHSFMFRCLVHLPVITSVQYLK